MVDELTPHLRRQRRQRYASGLWRSLWSPATVFIAVVGNVVLGGAVWGFHALESGVNPAVRTWLDSLWWGFATVTTVGFGDVVPITAGGRLIGMFLMLAGVSLFVAFTALVASGFSASIQQEIVRSEGLSRDEYERVMGELQRIDRRIEALALRLEQRG